MKSKDFLDYLKKIPEERAIAIIDDMNMQADRMADIINNKSNRLEKLVIPKIAELKEEFIKEFCDYDIDPITAQRVFVIPMEIAVNPLRIFEWFIDKSNFSA